MFVRFVTLERLRCAFDTDKSVFSRCYFFTIPGIKTLIWGYSKTVLCIPSPISARRFFVEWARAVVHALRPGGHVFIASNAFLSQLVFSALVDGGLEFRGELIRVVRTLRGGDRPKNAEEEFPGVSSLPRGCYEPWGILRKPMLPGMKLSDCLREFQTGGLRRDDL
jgi:site-specific DNA-methyltransferase (adenine-specific)